MLDFEFVLLGSTDASKGPHTTALRSAYAPDYVQNHTVYLFGSLNVSFGTSFPLHAQRCREKRLLLTAVQLQDDES
jgi:hypothetical protein